MSEAAIDDALYGHLAGLTFSPALPIAWPNKPFTNKPDPAPGAKWLRATMLPAEGRAVSLQRTAANIGTMQIDVFVYAGDGEDEGVDTVDQIKAHFAMGASIASADVKVRIVTPPFRCPVITSRDDPSWIMLPVRIRYTVYERAS